MTYKETLDYMFNSLPMYHRIGKAAYKADITNTVSMMEHLGHPERHFKSIHVAGTNGKGSVSHFLASTLMRVEKDNATLKVGLYTSPHLVDFRERIRINGQMVPQDYVVKFIEQNRDFFESHDLSFFEMTVGMAFQYFADEQVDIAVVEVGMGGRLDSTNVITPELCVITNIGLDHTQFLGDTLEKIAGEKAGIIKSGVPVVVGQTQTETRPVFWEKAQALNAPIIFADQHYRVVETADSDNCQQLRFHVLKNGQPLYGEMQSPMAGSYQLKNLATYMQSVECLQHQGWRISEQNIRDGVAGVVSETGLHGRWEQYGTAPAIVCETAHNEDGVREMLSKLRQMSYHRLHLIYGCVNDKDYSHILQLIGRSVGAFGGTGNTENSGTAGTPLFYYTQPSVPRGLAVAQLAETADALGMHGPTFPCVGEAIEAAKNNATSDDFILITGSIFLVADAVGYFRDKV